MRSYISLSSPLSVVATKATALANMRCVSPEPPAGGGTGATPHTSPPLKRRFLKKVGGAARSGGVFPYKLRFLISGR